MARRNTEPQRAARVTGQPDWTSIPIPDGTSAWGDRLAEWRLAQGIQQDELAGILAINRMTVSRWEKGLKAPAGDAAELLQALRDGGPLAVKRRALEAVKKKFRG